MRERDDENGTEGREEKGREQIDEERGRARGAGIERLKERQRGGRALRSSRRRRFAEESVGSRSRRMILRVWGAGDGGSPMDRFRKRGAAKSTRKRIAKVDQRAREIGGERESRGREEGERERGKGTRGGEGPLAGNTRSRGNGVSE